MDLVFLPVRCTVNKDIVLDTLLNALLINGKQYLDGNSNIKTD